MSEEKIAKLTEIGFRFGWVHHDNRWDMRYAELEEFKRQFGHCVVPHNYDDNPKLGKYQHTGHILTLNLKMKIVELTDWRIL